MATSRVKTWADQDVLTHTDLNAEFDAVLGAANTLENKVPTGTDFQFYDETVVDEGTFTLEAVTNHGWGKILANNGAVYAEFVVDNDGDVAIIFNSGDVVVNQDTDAYLCLGTAAAQEPLTIKNRLGSSYQITCFFWHN